MHVRVSQHAGQRMNQRGISRRLVDFALRHGRVEGNKHILDRNESRRVVTYNLATRARRPNGGRPHA